MEKTKLLLLILLLPVVAFSQFQERKEENWKFKLGFGTSTNYYQVKTTEWIGNHKSKVIFITLGKRNFNINVLFKPQTVNPLKGLNFDGVPLPQQAELNPIKLEMNLGYEYEMIYNFRIEPYLGYLNQSFTVINEEEIGHTYNIKSANGLTIGVNLFKYIYFGRGFSLGAFVNGNGNLINFQNVNPDLGNNYFALSFGLLFMGI